MTEAAKIVLDFKGAPADWSMETEATPGRKVRE
jgi:hypothetical protein